MRIAVASPTAEILARRTIPFALGDGEPEEVLTTIAQGIRRCAEAAGKDPKTLKGIGVSLAGYANVDNLTHRRGWEHVPICRMLEECLGAPAYMENDVRAAALAAQWFGDESTSGGALYLSVAEGIGGAIVHGDEILSGAHDLAGMIGHVTIDPDGPMCGCGKRGCLESMASDRAFISSLWPDVAPDAVEIDNAERGALMRRGVELVLSGDADANRALVTVTRHLGLALANAISTLDPRVVFIFGTLIDIAPDLTIDLIRRATLPYIWPNARGVDIRPLVGSEEFLLRGSIGLVLWQPYRALQQQNLSARSVVEAKPARARQRTERTLSHV